MECLYSANIATRFENLSIPNLHRGRALPRKWGTSGAKPAARRESEPVSPPNTSISPAQRSASSERGYGGATPMSAISSLLETEPEQKSARPINSTDHALAILFATSRH